MLAIENYPKQAVATRLWAVLPLANTPSNGDSLSESLRDSSTVRLPLDAEALCHPPPAAASLPPPSVHDPLGHMNSMPLYESMMRV